MISKFSDLTRQDIIKEIDWKFNLQVILENFPKLSVRPTKKVVSTFEGHIPFCYEVFDFGFQSPSGYL